VIIYYIAAVMATKLFGHSFPQWFGGLDTTSFTLFQIMTLEGWSGEIVRPIMEVYPYAWVFFVPFILITTFAVLNLIVGLIVNSMQEAASADERAVTEAFEAKVLARLEDIDRKLDQRG